MCPLLGGVVITVASGVLGAVSATVVVGKAWQKYPFLLSWFVSLSRRIFPATMSNMVGLDHISSAYRHSLRGSMATILREEDPMAMLRQMYDPGKIVAHVDGAEVPGCGEHNTETWCPGLYVCYS